MLNNLPRRHSGKAAVTINIVSSLSTSDVVFSGATCANHHHGWLLDGCLPRRVWLVWIKPQTTVQFSSVIYVHWACLPLRQR